MSRKKKLERFAQIDTYAHVVQAPFGTVWEKDHPIKGRWREDFFRNDKPIVLELACGKGEYTVSMARLLPERNFLGVDRKGNRMWHGATQALGEALPNVGFLRTDIAFLDHVFAPGEVDEIWITFPDPQPNKPRKRLSGAVFLSRYARLAKPGAPVNLKTDSQELYHYTRALLQANHIPAERDIDDLYHSEWADDSLLSIRTFYEKMWLAEGKPITYLRFALPGGAALVEPTTAADHA